MTVWRFKCLAKREMVPLMEGNRIHKISVISTKKTHIWELWRRGTVAIEEPVRLTMPNSDLIRYYKELVQLLIRFASAKQAFLQSFYGIHHWCSYHYIRRIYNLMTLDTTVDQVFLHNHFIYVVSLSLHQEGLCISKVAEMLCFI